MSSPTKTQRWVLREKPYGTPVLDGKDATFQLEEGVALPALQEGQVLLKTLYLSNDPAQRSWISPLAQAERLYLPPVQVGETMKSMGIAQVVASRCAAVPVGSLVTGNPGWAEYSVDEGEKVAVIEEIPAGLPVTHFLGALGLPGFTAYYALTQIVKATARDAIVVSGAAGAVGTMVVQIAKKMIGCRKVIGIAGTDEKCRWVEKLGADVCINYKSLSFKQTLTQETEGFVEIYFDNVGGEILDFMLTRLAKFGREVITMRLQILGFINIDWIDHLAEVRAILVEEWKKGTLVIGEESEMVVDTAFKDIPSTWMMLYSGGNTGKLVTRVK
ncbi:hypothetical protein ASPZODRAFT_149710 [Penicilliopsis zonata CBS 506.65]|uniref:Enoyl reductase (ER) domain-containing protein n=1 Tax=Penicilliopsis zonata CBS 506.65 TaxID=1073090 RepID=A0A1L9STG3_9EURO|nr:hypothetical protein ASPZODRAFT_149710 [Penicilliopsis zonata CBS 506.65]OJJ50373.1 hypothetical protein ASPZODRAFT_149710 [Penicilliopsis zonata CBS 506.65]